MKFSFNQFQFDCEQQLLFKDGVVVPLHDKASQLLTLLLKDSDKVHSKADILEAVWPDTYVSDQVVFQNISHLRALFGSEAIRTFVKKGYQWQLETNIIVARTEQKSEQKVSNGVTRDNDADVPPEKFAPISQNTADIFSLRNILTIVLMLVCLAMAWLITHNNSLKIDDTHTYQTQIANDVRMIRFENSQLQIINVIANITPQQFFDSPNRIGQKYLVIDSDRLIATQFYSTNSGVALRFHVQSKQRGWTDYIWATTKKEAMSLFNELLHEIETTEYFTVTSSFTALKELNIEDKAGLMATLFSTQGVKLLIEQNEYEQANVLVNQALEHTTSPMSIGSLNLLKSDITQWNRQWDIARKSAELAQLKFAQLSLPQLESQALIASSWVHLVQEEFRQGIKQLNKAASKARIGREPLLELEAHITQSFLASKSGQTELMYGQLNLAQELLELHKISNEHHIPVYMLLGWIEADHQKSLNYYLKVLAMPFNSRYASEFYLAAEKVRQFYITTKDWQNATSSILPWQRKSFQFITNATILFAQKNWQESANFAQNAFEIATKQHARIDAIEAALLLVQIAKKGNFVDNVELYSEYVLENAPRWWLERKNTLLTKSSLVKGNTNSD